MYRGIACACLFLFAAAACCVYASLHIIRYPALYYVFSLLAFLTAEGVDVYRALSTAFAAGDTKICTSLVRIQDAMRAGFSMEKAFAAEKMFSDMLFYIEIAALNGTVSNTFVLLSRRIEQKREQHEKIFLQTAEPAMLLAAGVYMLLLLNSTVMPLLLEYGGLL
jgi:type II secretory pathway component PulF